MMQKPKEHMILAIGFGKPKQSGMPAPLWKRDGQKPPTEDETDDIRMRGKEAAMGGVDAAHEAAESPAVEKVEHGKGDIGAVGERYGLDAEQTKAFARELIEALKGFVGGEPEEEGGIPPQAA